MYYMLLVISILILIIFVYNTILKKRNKLESAFSSLDVMLKKRYDLIPNVVETVKGYANYEKEVLENVTKLRNKIENKSDNTVEEISNEYNKFMKNVGFVIEKYPEIKASENFIHLQVLLNEIEEQISAARRTYNAHVESYNTYISMIPINVLASIFRFKKYNFFEISSEERDVVIWK